MTYYVDGMGGGSKDNKISKNELAFAVQYYNQYMRNAGVDMKDRTMTQSVDVILRACDKGHDGQISKQDFGRTAERCFSTCEDTTSFMRAICTPAQHEEDIKLAKGGKSKKRETILPVPKAFLRSQKVRYEKLV